MTTQPEWQEALLHNVADLDAKRKDGRRKFVLDPDQRTALLEAARMRGISENAYIRRAVLAMVCYDLGIEWSDMMASEGAVRKAGQAAVYDRTPMQGRGFGRWRIVGLR